MKETTIANEKLIESNRYIYINYVNIVKENIYLKLEKPVDNKISESNFIAFPTNITNLPKIRSEPMITRIIDENAFCFIYHPSFNAKYNN